MGAIQSVLLSVRLVGLHRFEGSILASSRTVASTCGCGLRQALPVRALCFNLSTGPQVFSRVMTPISTILHGLGICLRQYLDDWLIHSNSSEAVLQALSTVLSICRELGVVVKPENSNFVPAQRVQSLGTVLDAQTFRASPSRERIDKLMSLGDEILFSRLQPASDGLPLLGT